MSGIGDAGASKVGRTAAADDAPAVGKPEVAQPEEAAAPPAERAKAIGGSTAFRGGFSADELQRKFEEQQAKKAGPGDVKVKNKVDGAKTPVAATAKKSADALAKDAMIDDFRELFRKDPAQAFKEAKSLGLDRGDIEKALSGLGIEERIKAFRTLEPTGESDDPAKAVKESIAKELREGKGFKETISKLAKDSPSVLASIASRDEGLAERIAKEAPAEAKKAIGSAALRDTETDRSDLLLKLTDPKAKPAVTLDEIANFTMEKLLLSRRALEDPRMRNVLTERGSDELKAVAARDILKRGKGDEKAAGQAVRDIVGSMSPKARKKLVGEMAQSTQFDDFMALMGKGEIAKTLLPGLGANDVAAVIHELKQLGKAGKGDFSEAIDIAFEFAERNKMGDAVKAKVKAREEVAD